MRCVMLWGFIFISTSVLASDYHSARTDGLGGAGHAGPMLNDAIYLNPSFESFLPTYSFAFNYNWYHGGDTQPDGSSYVHGHGANASVQDGRSEMFQAGVAASQTESAQMIHLGASKSIIKQLGVGMGAKMIFPNQGDPITRDATFSVSGVIDQMFQAVLVIDNILEPNPGSLGMYREVILGTKINIMGILLFYIDPHYVGNLNPHWGHESGVELTIMKDLFFRGGLFLNSQIPFEATRGNGYSFGIGWLSPRMSLDGAITSVIQPVNATNFSTGITLYF